jgi:broad specificity phosphatase PhoE
MSRSPETGQPEQKSEHDVTTESISTGPLRIWLVRHGLTGWNLEGRWQGWSDTPLHDDGRAQARGLRTRFAGKRFDAVISSDLCRASETAQLAGFEPLLEPRLRELNFGDFEAALNNDNSKLEAFQYWIEDPVHRRTPNGESYADLQRRVLDWLETLPDSGDVLTFSHGGTIQVLITSLLKIPPLAASRIWTLRVLHSSISVLERWETPNGRVWTLERLNDTAHLERNSASPG